MMDSSIKVIGGWEADFGKSGDFNHRYWARNLASRQKRYREWHWTKPETLRQAGFDLPDRTTTTWEVDWEHPSNTGSHVMARNLRGHTLSSREWHMTATGYLRSVGIKTPAYRADSWEVDWQTRSGKKVWARNPKSKHPSAREWHWVEMTILNSAGLEWQPKRIKTGRTVNKAGYVMIARFALSPEDEALADEHGIWLGSKKSVLVEHRLVALKKYGGLPRSVVVRHINGIKDDNRPENLVLGSIAENNMDHETSRRMMMYWRERCEKAEAELAALREQGAD